MATWEESTAVTFQPCRPGRSHVGQRRTPRQAPVRALDSESRFAAKELVRWWNARRVDNARPNQAWRAWAVRVFVNATLISSATISGESFELASFSSGLENLTAEASSLVSSRQRPALLVSLSLSWVISKLKSCRSIRGRTIVSAHE